MKNKNKMVSALKCSSLSSFKSAARGSSTDVCGYLLYLQLYITTAFVKLHMLYKQITKHAHISTQLYLFIPIYFEMWMNI